MTDRLAPVQADKSHVRGTVPWEVHERAWKQYAAVGGPGGQSAEKIAERGGFGYTEMACLLAGHNPYSFDARHLRERHDPVPQWRAA